MDFKSGDGGRDIVVTMPDGVELITQLALLDARPESLTWAVRYGHGYLPLSTFKSWRWPQSAAA